MRGKNLSGLEVTPAMLHVRHATKIASEVTKLPPSTLQPVFIITLRFNLNFGPSPFFFNLHSYL